LQKHNLLFIIAYYEFFFVIHDTIKFYCDVLHMMYDIKCKLVNKLTK